MSKINSFEDLKVWQLARMLAKDIYLNTQKDKFAKDYSLKDQINRSAGSTMDNIAERFERGGNKEFVQFLYIAIGSCGEVRSQLVRALDRMYLDTGEFAKLNLEATEISKQLSGFISYLKNSELKGEKFIKEPEESYGSKSNLEF